MDLNGKIGESVYSNLTLEDEANFYKLRIGLAVPNAGQYEK